MLPDIEGGMPVESDHILGNLLGRAAKPDDHSLLRIAYVSVKAYQARRMRGKPV
jgi:2-dehydropantoate 2-reductase